MVQKPKLAEEMEKMAYEPLAPVELTLVRWSIDIGLEALLCSTG